MQFAAFAVALLFLHLTLLDSGTVLGCGLIVATLLCLAWQSWWIIPYTFFWPKEVATARTGQEENGADQQLSILTANVLMTNHNSEALLLLVKKHQPDILVTLETNQWWQDKLDTLLSDMPHSIQCPLDNLYGMHVYSRLPLAECETTFLVEDDVPSMHALIKLRCGDDVRMHFLHPAPPSPTENAESKERDAEMVIVARSIADSDQPVIVTGDFNDVAWSATTRLFRKISKLLDPRIGRGMFNTFHAKYPFLRWPLDHLFHSKHFTLRSMQRMPSIGSDHFALLTELSFTPHALTSHTNADQEGIKADSEDQARASAIVNNTGKSGTDVPEPGE